MNYFLTLDFLLGWVTAIITLIAFVLLVRTKHEAWLLLLVEPIWQLIASLNTYSGQILELEVDPFAIHTLIFHILTLGILVYAYFQWKKNKKTNYTTRTEHFDILDSLDTERVTLNTKKLSTENMLEPITFGIITFIVLGFIKVVLLGYSLAESYEIVFHFNDVAYFLGIYMLSKLYIEGWLVLFISLVAIRFLYFTLGVPLDWTLFYPILELVIFGLGYIEWKKLYMHTTSHS